MQAILVGLFGPMGSGKSYEAMKFHVLPALKAGQRVATNIEGLTGADRLTAMSSFTGRTPAELQSLIIQLPKTKDELFAPGVLPNPLDWSAPSLVPPGSKLVLDECSTIFDAKLPEHVMRYLTEQRHGVDEHGNVGSTVIISQSPQIHHSVRRIMSVAYVFSQFSMLAPFMKVLRPLGLGADYRAEVYTDMSKSFGKSKPDNLIMRRYDAKVFPCYKSVNAEEFKRLGLDKRTTLLGNKYVVVFIPVMLCFAYYGGKSLFSVFGGALSSAAVQSSATSPPSTSAGSTPSNTSVSPAKIPSYFDKDLSDSYRYVGQYMYGSQNLYVVQHKSGYYRYVAQAELRRAVFAGPAVMLELFDGTKITHYTGNFANVSSTAPAGSATGPGSAAAFGAPPASR